MAKAILKTDFHFDGQKSLYKGKVRDVYNIDDKYLVMVVSDRISAFDVVLPKGIPYKGQVLNQIASCNCLDGIGALPGSGCRDGPSCAKISERRTSKLPSNAPR